MGLTPDNGTLLWEHPWKTQHDVERLAATASLATTVCFLSDRLRQGRDRCSS